ncbi:ABC transporter permease [Bosea lathyri]|uniref:Amino acid ABC transporter membrane protein 1, PAAT family n=1 Tax=Bosea lathyri TaxID=1036778 RepID=A0A1H6D9M3_9HYPH|nr:ABC transporter permease subunit [Bosea lathyri]SEG81878.1 amino acid ABC transporter membrane protein 1, PAAT family [Bosea lathyri]
MEDILTLFGFGPTGWGGALLKATGMTLSVAACGFVLGSIIGSLVAWAKLRGNGVVRAAANGYTTVLRGIPDLLVIYLFYFGGSALLTSAGRMFGADGFVGVPAFASGAAAIGVISGAYQAEVFRGAFQSVSRGELEAARSVGMRSVLMFRRIVIPQVLRLAMPGLGNVWQLVLKESALISITGLVELLRQSHVAAGSTGRPFEFYILSCVIYFIIAISSTRIFNVVEARMSKGFGRMA